MLCGAVVPRPIALVSTFSEKGVFNVAPFSSYASICNKPMTIGFGTGSKRDGQKKDTLINIEYSKDFVINAVTEDLVRPMNQSSYEYPGDVSEFEKVGLTPVKADMVKSPLVAEAPVNMECRVVKILEFGDVERRSYFIIGEILLVHIKDELYINGEIQMAKLKAVARLGGQLYCRTEDVFEIERPQTLS